MGDEAASTETATRMIALGSEALTAGFGLIGFETIPNARPDDLEELLAQLVRANHKAMVVVESDLARSEGVWLKRVRDEGGRIVVTTVPGLNAPGEFRPPVEDLVASILGAAALEERG